MNFNFNISFLKNIAKLEGNRTQIDTQTEVTNLKNSIFDQAGVKNSAISADSFVKSTNHTKVNNTQIQAGDAIAAGLVEAFAETGIDNAKLNKYMSVPMKSIDSLNKAFANEMDPEIKELAQFAENIDINKLNAYLAVYAGEEQESGRIGGSVAEFENSDTAKLLDSMLEIEYAGLFENDK